MTISDTDVRAVYQGNGSTTTFAIPFDYETTAEIKVYLRDEGESPATETLQVISTHYTISAPNIVFVTAPAADNKVLVIRENTYTQATDFLSTGTFNPENIEEALDKLTRLIQEVEEKTDRALKFALTSSNANMDFPEPVASKGVAFNSAGTGLTTANIDSFGSPIVNADIDSAAAIAFSKMAALTASRILASDASGVVSVNSSLTADRVALINGTGSLTSSSIQSLAVEQLLKTQSSWNLALAAATTTNANDSIKITSYSGTALSASNPGFISLPSATTGLLTTFQVTSDVTILLTGAHWGQGTRGDLTDYKLVVYAINDAGSLKWGSSPLSQLKTVSGSDDETTPTSVTTNIKVLVNSALSGSSDCVMFGRFNANFDDTGGAAEDLWAVQVGQGDIRLGFEDIPIAARYTTNTASAMGNNAQTIIDYEDRVLDTHNAVTVGASWKFTAPVTGVYEIVGGYNLADSAGWAATEEYRLDFFSNNVRSAVLHRFQFVATVGAHQASSYGSSKINLAKGDFIDFRCFQNSGASVNLGGDSEQNWVAVTYAGSRNQ